MDEDRGAELAGRGEEVEQLRRVEVPVADVRADLHALQPELVHAALQLLDRQPRRLHRHGAEAGEMARVRAHDRGHVVVERGVQLQRVVRLGPVAEHHRHGADHLDLHAEARVVGDALVRVPGLGPDLAEELAVLVDPVAPVVAVVDDREAGVAVLRGEVGPVARQVVGVGVDLEHGFRRVGRRA